MGIFEWSQSSGPKDDDGKALIDAAMKLYERN